MTILIILIVLFLIGHEVFRRNPVLGWRIAAASLVVPVVLLVVVLILTPDGQSLLKSTMAISVLAGLAVAVSFLVAGVWVDANTPPPNYMHNHGGLWHEHHFDQQREGHFHPHDINGPFVYTDERVIDQRQEN